MKKILLLLFIILTYAKIESQSYFFNHLDVSSGLPSNFVSNTFVDSYGYVWIGTLNGISRYDGKELIDFSLYFPDKIESITSISEDSQKSLWIGTTNGLYHWNRISSKFDLVKLPGIKDQNIIKLQFYTNNKLYVATYNAVFTIDSDSHQITNLSVENKQLHNVNTMVIDDDSIFIATDYGLAYNHISITNPFFFAQSKNIFNAQNRITDIIKNDNRIYIGSNKGLLSYTIASSKFTSLKEFSKEKISCLRKYKKQLLVGLKSNGVRIYDLNKQSVFDIRHSFSDLSSITSNAVTSIVLDKNGILWASTFGKGLSYTQFTDGVFTYYRSNNHSLSNYSIRSLFIDDENNKYVGTRNGFVTINSDHEVTFYNSANSQLGSPTILSVLDHEEKLLLSTFEGGIYSYSLEKKQIEEWNPDYFHDQVIYSMVTDTMGRIWIGGYDGLFMVSNTKEIVHFSTRNSSLTFDCIYDIKIDEFNRIWVGGKSGVSIYSLQNNQLVLEQKLEIDFGKRVVNLFIDSSSQVWVGTDKKGLFVFDMNMNLIRNINEDTGLCNNSLASVIQSSSNIYWIATLNGICRYNFDKDEYLNYNAVAGLPRGFFIGGEFTKDQDGQIWLGNENGLVLINERKIISNTEISKVVVTDIYVDTKPIHEVLIEEPQISVEEIHNIELSGQHNNIGFKFSSLNVISTNDYSYVAILEGKDQDWVQLSKESSINYKSLSPGNYVFKCGLSYNNGSVLNDSIKTIYITVHRQWYKTIIAIVVILILLVFLLLKYRKLKKEAQLNSKPKERYELSLLNEDESKAILGQIQKYFEESKIYLQPDLKVLDISEKLDISVPNLSQSINENLNQGFSSFVNQYRVNEIILRTEDPKYSKYTLFAIAETCGFKSNSSFYRAFKKVTGKTPSEYVFSRDIK